MDDALLQLTRLFSLLLGLGIAAILSGLALAWRITSGVQATSVKIRIGALIPLLGLLVILDQTSFVVTSAELLQHMGFNYASLLAVLVVIGGYYAISTFVFPDKPTEWPTYDAYYVRISRLVVSGMIAINLITLVYEIFVSRSGVNLRSVGGAGGSGMGFGDPASLIAELTFFPLLGALLFVRSRKISLYVLLACNLLMLFDAVYPLLTGQMRASELKDDFDDLSRLFALLIGLAITVLVGGLARCWRLARHVTRRHAHPRIGWLVPLLGLLLILNQARFFLSAFELNRHVPFSYLSILAVLAVIGGYYVISTFVVPEDSEEWPDFDAYYMKVKRLVIGGMVTINVIAGIYMFGLVLSGVTLDQVSGNNLQNGLIAATLKVAFIAVIAALFFATSKRANVTMLFAAILLMLGEATLSFA